MDGLRITIKYKGEKAARLAGLTSWELIAILKQDLHALRLNHPKREDVFLTEAGTIWFIRRLNDHDKADHILLITNPP